MGPQTRFNIEPVSARNIETYGQITATGFQWGKSWRDAAIAGLAQRIKTKQYHAFLAMLDGQPVGCGAIFVHDNAANLTNGAVLAEHRGQGVHLALLHHRMHAAGELGCELVFGGADFGSASFRNQQRIGLRLAFIESTWAKT